MGFVRNVGFVFLTCVHDSVGEGSSNPVGTSWLKLNTISISTGHCRPHLQVPHDVRCFNTSFLFHSTRLSGLHYITKRITRFIATFAFTQPNIYAPNNISSKLWSPRRPINYCINQAHAINQLTCINLK